jgi:anti-anti-sigma regulatory factor
MKIDKRKYYLLQLTELKTIIANNKAAGRKSGPVITGLHERLARIFETTLVNQFNNR